MMSQKFCSGTCTKEITDRIVKMIIRDSCPVRSVECEGFIELISFLEPGYVMPSRKAVKSTILNIYDQTKKKLVDFFWQKLTIGSHDRPYPGLPWKASPALLPQPVPQ